MNYGRCNEPVECRSVGTDCCSGPDQGRFDGPLVQLMGETQCVGLDIVNMSEKIRSNLFGSSNAPACERKGDPPMCHTEALAQHRGNLIQAAEALAIICSLLGV